MLKVWPTREPIQRLPPAQFNRLLEQLVTRHCRSRCGRSWFHLGCYPQADQGCRFSHPCWMSHLSGKFTVGQRTKLLGTDWLDDSLLVVALR